MIIERCRELALRAPARVVFPDALDQRVLKAAQYLHQQGLATPILVANPFELRQFALSHGVAVKRMSVSRATSLPRQMCCVPDYALSACSQAVKRSLPFS